MTCAIDIFSSGCVISELFLGGESIFSLAQLLAYRKGDYTPSPKLGRGQERMERIVTELGRGDQGRSGEGDGRQNDLPGPVGKEPSLLLPPQLRVPRLPLLLPVGHVCCMPEEGEELLNRTFLHPFVWKCGAEMLPDDSIESLRLAKDEILANLKPPERSLLPQPVLPSVFSPPPPPPTLFSSSSLLLCFLLPPLLRLAHFPALLLFLCHSHPCSSSDCLLLLTFYQC
eukprot:746716-Hanusia_phi.AAC.7